ncbi:MAG TPA: DUF3127 domain-containing protein [Chitinophagales bacterium]|nr:DUF3127 domain-containing protein [Chitinophagales bacterium]HMU70462.1 DUF3127 domain-containing protein [Chitinophagales bacterium]HNE46163.1 DUF3127 domain-containing protein [Chitinophagales bacterium]HNF70326.1 DUF3127 domain-containing protein [Chitinophagales bacterium]HNI55622.1 DUF3127 domain-containing protein [Chitinophagales bacterium]
MAYELTGKVLEIFPTQEVSATFKKREFVIEKSESSGDRTFTDFIKFQLIQDRCALADNFKIGDEVKVTFNIKGSKWEKEGRTNYFTNLDVWRMERVSGNNQAPASQDTYQEPAPLPEVEDDLPF